MSEEIWPAAVASLIAWEGGLADDPADPGGLTKFGISQRSYPELDIRNLTEAEAEAIYRRDWWELHGLAELPDPIGAKLLNAGVNTGMAEAVRCLQRALSAQRTRIAIDGVLGPQTRAAAGADPDPAALVAETGEELAHYYERLAEEHPALGRFLAGWRRRARASGLDRP